VRDPETLATKQKRTRDGESSWFRLPFQFAEPGAALQGETAAGANGSNEAGTEEIA
jgi:hypothetical protein